MNASGIRTSIVCNTYLWRLAVAAASSVVYGRLCWRNLWHEERGDLVAHLPAPVRALLPA